MNADLHFADTLKRYTIVRKLGEGGMGEVYQAIDRLNSETIALKRVTRNTHQLGFSSRPADGSNIEVALVNEFKTLASLRHPNIIRVLDYGFDSQRCPYFTMELLEYPLMMLDIAAAMTLDDKIQTLMQMLQALIYLHQRGILHRDLKPENVAVLDGNLVKLLDFGLATEVGDITMGGTLLYMPPEVLRSEPVSPASDLYTVGLLAYEMFSGQYPFATAPVRRTIHEILHVQPDLLNINPSLALVIARLLSKDPADRYASARDTLIAVANAVGLEVELESVEIRESFLQTAPLVGRQKELTQLEKALKAALGGHGNAYLVGGESGIGKSRLTWELRTRALIAGVHVLYGQASRETSTFYRMWRDPLRLLVLLGDATDEQAQLLKPLVPDIETLLNRLVPDPAAAVDPRVFGARLVDTVLALIRQSKQPITLIFEDLQWVQEESLNLLNAVASRIDDLPCFIVGNYRSDERAELPDALPTFQLLGLSRLGRKAIDNLSEAILGATGANTQLTDFLARETEGNAFFVVEIIRELAARAGTFGDIGNITLPEHLLTGGIQSIIQQRIERLEEVDRALLSIAAVAGRDLDLPVMQVFNGGDLSTWLLACQNTALLEVTGERWQFAHDKVRDILLESLTPEQQRDIHEQLATVIEQVYPDDIALVVRLTRHWQSAGNDAKTLHYATIAANEALRLYAYKQGRNFLSISIEASKRLPDTPENRLLRIDLMIKLVNISLIARSPQENLATMEEIRGLVETGANATIDLRRRFDIHYMMGRTYYYYTQPLESLHHFRLMSEAAQELNDSDRVMFAVSMAGRVLSLQGLFKDALATISSFDSLERLGLWTEWMMNLGYVGYCLVATGQADEGIRTGQVALMRAEELRHASVKSVATVFLAMSYWQASDYAHAIEQGNLTIETARQSGEKMPMHLGYGFRAWAKMRAGQVIEAWQDFQEYDALVTEMGGRLVYADWFAAARAELYLHMGLIDDALATAQAAVEFANQVNGIFAGGIAHRVWAQALQQSGGSREEIERHLSRSASLLAHGSAAMELARTKKLQ